MRYRNQLESKRASEGEMPALAVRAEPTTITIDGHQVVNVPKLFAAYMDGSTGKWVRYAADQGKNPVKAEGTEATKMIGTSGLTSCVDVNLISKKGVIKSHIPPYLCPLMPGGDSKKATQKQKDEYAALKSGLQKLFKDHKSALGANTKVYVAMGGNAQRVPAVQIVKELFGATSFVGNAIDVLPVTATHKTTRIDFSTNPPKFYIDGQETPVSVLQ